MAIANVMPPEGSRPPAQNHASLAIIAAACLTMLNALLHASVYGNRNYREDEGIGNYVAKYPN